MEEVTKSGLINYKNTRRLDRKQSLILELCARPQNLDIHRTRAGLVLHWSAVGLADVSAFSDIKIDH